MTTPKAARKRNAKAVKKAAAAKGKPEDTVTGSLAGGPGVPPKLPPRV